MQNKFTLIALSGTFFKGLYRGAMVPSSGWLSGVVYATIMHRRHRSDRLALDLCNVLE